MMEIPGLKAVRNYPEMLNKISFWTMINLIFGLITLRTQVEALDKLIVDNTRSLFIATGSSVEISGIKVNIATVVLAVVAGFVLRAFKFHDKLSDLFRIRHRFDYNEILMPLARGVGVHLDDDLSKKLKRQRKDLMYDVFYKYASSGSSSNVVDNHLIWSAMDQWSWFWVVLEGVFVWGAVGVAVLFFGEQLTAVYIISVAIVVGVVFMYFNYKECKKYTHRETAQILEEPNSRSGIEEVFRAL